MRDTKIEIVNFCFVETDTALWFQRNPDFDARIKDKYEQTYIMAKDGLCDPWMDDADGALALVMVLDQFPRNIYRGTAQAYATDAKALIVAKQAIAKGFDQMMTPEKKRSLYRPFMHSEHLSDQETSVKLFKSMEDVDPLGYHYALRHRDTIDRFGRFPHRNKALSRESTDEELAFLKSA